ncbi:TrkA C-terminal domain-containing protein [Bosea sp. R86505]|uniref:aspartate-alanine antiporter-like transporter n=1 Tax=Bosea sp. R86505 TaxID=3101710 RepID=UPI00366F6EF8
MVWFGNFLVGYPELAVFLAIGLGYWIGSVSFGAFKLGPVTGSLFAGLSIGQFAEVPVSPIAKSFLFLLFLFGIGYSVGPQFVASLKRDGLKPVALAIVTTVAGLLTAISVAKVLGLDAGYAAGLVSGSLTESPAMGTATDAINALSIPAAEKARLISHIAVADAVCYISGSVLTIWFISSIAPRLIGADLVAESLKLETELGITRQASGIVSAWRPYELRAFRIGANSPLIGLSIAECEKRSPGERMFAQRIRRAGELIEVSPNTTIAANDVVAVSGKREALVALIGPDREEVEDVSLLDMPVAMLDVLVSAPGASGRRLGDLAGLAESRNVYPRSLKRGGQEIPISAQTELHRGDILRLIGHERAVETAAALIGQIVRPPETTDFVVLGLAIFLGGLVGTVISIPIGGLTISLGTSVGALLAGLLVGHLRTRHPLFGRIPDGAVTLMTSLGLAAFVAMTGLHAGPIFFSALAEAGIGLMFGGMVVTLTPLLTGLAFGHFVLRMNPVLLLGGLAGSMTMTAAMAAVQVRANSPVAVLGYTPAVPLAHILLTTWGTVIVGVIAKG